LSSFGASDKKTCGAGVSQLRFIIKVFFRAENAPRSELAECFYKER